jgi:signal peptidase I
MEKICDIYNNSLFFDIMINLLKEGKRTCFLAYGGSMYPTIIDGDILHIEPISPEQTSKRDILLYIENGYVVVHRLISICQRQGRLYFLTRGDNSFGITEISSNQILGRVFRLQRQGKIISPNNSLYYYLYIYLRNFFAHIFRRLPFGFTKRVVTFKNLFLSN